MIRKEMTVAKTYTPGDCKQNIQIPLTFNLMMGLN
jgi:hypothetical protein